MKKNSIAMVLILACCVYSISKAAESAESHSSKTASQLAAEAAKKGVYDFDKLWGKEIYAFQRWDAKNSFPDNAVLFVGSSSIKLWDTAHCFPEIKLINRGFGGSDIKAVNYFFDKVVTPYKPSKIVLYAGDNEISRGGESWVVCEDFKVFYQLCSEKLPDAEIIYISIKSSNLRIKFSPVMQKANALIKEFCETKPNLQYIDLASCLLDDSGVPDDTFFAKDRLHLNKEGYRLWTDKLKPLLLVPSKKPASKR